MLWRHLYFWRRRLGHPLAVTTQSWALHNYRAISMCWDSCQVTALQVSVIYFFPGLWGKCSHQAHFTDQGIEVQSVNQLGGAGLTLELRTGPWMLRWNAVSPPSSLYLLRAMAIGGVACSLHRTGREAELSRKTNLSSACQAAYLGEERGAFWVPGGLGASPNWTGDLALLLVSKLFSLLEPQISHPSNGVITSRLWWRLSGMRSYLCAVTGTA